MRSGVVWDGDEHRAGQIGRLVSAAKRSRRAPDARADGTKVVSIGLGGVETTLVPYGWRSGEGIEPSNRRATTACRF